MPFGCDSDIVIINTCAVTEESARKSRQFARRVKRGNPGAILAVVGCYSQICDDSSLDFADIRLGTKNKSSVVPLICRFIEKKEKTVSIFDLTTETVFEKMISDHSEHIRADVKIQDGCNNFCSYCIIPYARGRIRSKDINDAEKEITALVGKGYKEIVLTGIHIASYGLDGKGYNLCDLLERIDKIDGIKRIRIGSVEPNFINEENVERLKNIKHLCRHFHLSLQSGSDSVLRRMNRKYTSAEYMNSVRLLKDAFDGVSLTTDVIVGFCGETDDEFAETCEFVRKVGFSKIHLFPFSPRKGTAAYKLEDLSGEIKNRRMSEIKLIEKELEYSYRSEMIGKVFSIIIEKISGEFSEGYTDTYIKVKIKGYIPVNELADVMIMSIEGECCVGELL